jgi:hypothetical protein
MRGLEIPPASQKKTFSRSSQPAADFLEDGPFPECGSDNADPDDDSEADSAEGPASGVAATSDKTAAGGRTVAVKAACSACVDPAPKNAKKKTATQTGKSRLTQPNFTGTSSGQSGVCRDFSLLKIARWGHTR